MEKELLLLSACPPPEGGIATWTLEYLDYCSTHNYSVDMVNIAMTGSRRDSGVNNNRNYIDELFRTRNIFRELKYYYKNNNYKICHINSSCSRFGIIRDYISIRVAKKRNSKVAFHCHCHVPNQVHDRFQSYFFKKICRDSDAVIVLNNKSKEFVARFAPKQLFLMPNFIDIGQHCNKRLIRHEIKKILYVGHVIRQKGIDIIIEVARQYPNIDFILVGPIDKYYSSLSIPNNIRMLGAKKHDEVVKYMVDSDVFLFPSFSEGFSISLLEAMFYGLPIIASDVGANKDMISEKGGIILDNNDSKCVSSALSTICDSKTRENMSSWNHNRVIEMYSKKVVLDLLFRIYDNL
ncbi:glycosyltransferase family 4 protein [Butyrivibrio sp. AE2032]|uniref:glycosyltransferase family 4 protein n=1 Tax=Butyrivibrio sp. AE2032 TaxID=1458463 RepID=UPI00054E7C0C|nr:glycosyltransferase family 4 protein [Butyrivibrio sp. AE2032]